MTQYIDKDALVAKIDNLKRKVDDRYRYSSGWKDALRMLETELDTIEVKEVDLEKEIQAFSKMELEPIKIYDANVSLTITMHQLYQCAKHFFELGMIASNKA